MKRRINIWKTLVIILSGMALFLSLFPFFQTLGGYLAIPTLVFAWFVLKWIREQNTEEQKAKRAVRRSAWALFFGIIVAGGCKLHSSWYYVEPLQETAAKVRAEINKQISEQNQEDIDAQKQAKEDSEEELGNESGEGTQDGDEAAE